MAEQIKLIDVYKKRKLKVASLINEDLNQKWNSYMRVWDSAFNITNKILLKNSFEQILDFHPDILFFTEEHLEYWKNNFYLKFFKLSKSRRFFLVMIKEKRNPNDYKFIKDLRIDNIIYLEDSNETITWNTMSILRQFWTSSNNKNVVFYKDFILDLKNNFISKNGEEINLTKNELLLFQLIYKYRKTGIFKSKILKIMWNDDEKDVTRVVDALLHRLKQKIGSEYFISRKLKVRLL
ncbi:MAG: winged helix-turn-helix domain-containing protein [Mollicutes bacterium PWAP]|nr:winged helix-turn-helix domain-containing protein [Mollicutes bacterium PWAP]